MMNGNAWTLSRLDNRCDPACEEGKKKTGMIVTPNRFSSVETRRQGLDRPAIARRTFAIVRVVDPDCKLVNFRRSWVSDLRSSGFFRRTKRSCPAATSRSDIASSGKSRMIDRPPTITVRDTTSGPSALRAKKVFGPFEDCSPACNHAEKGPSACT